MKRYLALHARALETRTGIGTVLQVTMSRRVAVVTGANSGIGLATAKALACPPHSYHVVLACRSEAAGEEAAATVRRACAEASVEVLPLDLAELSSVVAFAARVAQSFRSIHALVCNAGIGGLARPSAPTPDGAELVYRVNFVGHFVLLQRLLPLLEAGAPSRVVTLSSVMHHFGHTRWLEPLEYPEGLEPGSLPSTYPTSKLALAVLAAEVSRRYASRGVVGVACNPGAVNSQIWYRGSDSWGSTPRWLERLFGRVFRLAFLTPDQAACVAVSAATDDGWAEKAAAGPLYLCPYRTPWRGAMLFELHGPFAGPRVCRPHRAVGDPEAGRDLWEGMMRAKSVASYLI